MKHAKSIAAVTAIGGVAAAVFAVAGPASADVPLCSSSQLRPVLESSQGAAGHHYDTWQLTNVGGTCHTRGWVGASNFGPDGRPLPTAVTRVGGPAPAIVLSSGQHASWIFGYGNPAILGCTPENAPAMIVTPPDNVIPVLAHPGENACHGAVTATPLQFGG
jgi:hypothetical protein